MPFEKNFHQHRQKIRLTLRHHPEGPQKRLIKSRHFSSDSETRYLRRKVVWKDKNLLYCVQFLNFQIDGLQMTMRKFICYPSNNFLETIVDAYFEGREPAGGCGQSFWKLRSITFYSIVFIAFFSVKIATQGKPCAVMMSNNVLRLDGSRLSSRWKKQRVVLEKHPLNTVKISQNALVECLAHGDSVEIPATLDFLTNGNSKKQLLI